MPRDDLVCDGVEIVSRVLRLSGGIQHIVVDALDQPGFPADRLGAHGVPGMAGDEAHLGRRCAKRSRDLGVSLRRRLVPFGGVVDAESPVEQVDQPAVSQLASGDGGRVVRQGEEVEARRFQPPQGSGNVGIGRHGGEPIGELLAVSRGDLDAPGRGDLLQDSAADVSEGDIDVGDRQGLGVGDELLEPETHGAWCAEQALKDRCDGREIEDRFVAVENDVMNGCHGGAPLRGSGVFQLHELRGDFGQGRRDDLRLLEAMHDDRRDAGAVDQGGGATGGAGADEIPGMRGDHAQV